MSAPRRTVCALTFDLEEYFQVSAFSKYISRSSWQYYSGRAEASTYKILALLELRQIKATFFVLGWFAERHARLVREIDSLGHEVASHGYEHQLVYRQTPGEFRRDIRATKDILESAIGKPVLGYRAPSYSIVKQTLWALEILAEEGYQYDSSIFPIHHDRYGIPGFERKPHIIETPAGPLAEFPPTTTQFLGRAVPVCGGGYFRILPFAVTRWGLNKVESEGTPAIFYLHPWEFDPEQPRVQAGILSRFRHYTHLDLTQARFIRLLQLQRFGRVDEVLGGLGLLSTTTAAPAAADAPVSLKPSAPFGTFNSVSLVVPAFNEERSVVRLYDEASAALRSLGCEYEIIFVDDGSTDGTYGRVLELRERDERVKIFKLRKNFGQTAAMACGFDYASGDVIVSMDGDLQNDPADIPALLREIDRGFDIVCGWRVERKDRWISRRLPSLIANALVRKVTGVQIHDLGCSLKAYRAGVIRGLKLYSDMHRFIPAVSQLAGARVTEIQVNHRPRLFGVSKYGLSRTYKILIDLISIKMLTRFTFKPLVGFVWLGSPAFILACGFAIFAVNELWRARSAGDSVSVVFFGAALLSFFLGTFLLFVGLIAELALKSARLSPTALAGLSVQNGRRK